MQCHCTVIFVNIEQKIKDATNKRCTLYFLKPENPIFPSIILMPIKITILNLTCTKLKPKN